MPLDNYNDLNEHEELILELLSRQPGHARFTEDILAESRGQLHRGTIYTHFRTLEEKKLIDTVPFTPKEGLSRWKHRINSNGLLALGYEQPKFHGVPSIHL
jgi:hypothetical protein